MKKGLQSLIFLLSGSLLLASATSFADDVDLKGEGTLPPAAPGDVPQRKLYKGEIEASAYATNALPDGEYSGKAYKGDLYQGALEDSATPPFADRSLHDGFYLGLQIGYDSYSTLHNVSAVAGGIPVFQENVNVGAAGFAGGIFGGIGCYADGPLYFGAELFMNNSSANGVANVSQFAGIPAIYYIKSSVNESIGVSFLPGLKLTDSSLLYLRGGYTRVQIRTQEASGAIAFSNNQNNWVNGFHWGMGLESDIYKKISVRGEYLHAHFNSFTTSVGTNVTATDNQVTLGLLYHMF